MRLFQRLFIANRGEVAARVARTCDRLGIEPVFGVSTADAEAPWVRGRQKVVLGPPRARDSYLAMERVVQAALMTQCTAVHPGWGFLAENATFATLCENHGVTFIGPPAHVMHLMGQKTPAKKAMAQAGLTLIGGSDGVLADLDDAQAVADRVGYPVLIKAQSGGGGRGMRIARDASSLEQAFADAQSEARAAFGDERVYLERLIERGRHIEVQLLADRYGNVVHIGERDCTVQRNHQKLIEESCAPTLSDAERERTFAAAVRATADIGYVGAGTMEFLLDHDGKLRFMEMNTRLQVEHCVSEVRSGLDLVEQQILVAAGHRLALTQAEIQLQGHAIECRINAEDPDDGFRPSPGLIEKWKAPVGEGIRVDTHVESGYRVPPHYDSLLCKVIGFGPTREEASHRVLAALGELVCDGVRTTASLHQRVLSSEAFQSGEYSTAAIPGFQTEAS